MRRAMSISPSHHFMHFVCALAWEEDTYIAIGYSFYARQKRYFILKMEDLSAAKLYRECKGGSKILEKLPLERGAHVLDLGCGTGELAAVMAERVGPKGRVTAVDPDSARIKVAMETYGGKSNLEFAVASDADFPEGEYDIVCANLVLHWIEDKNATFKRVFKNLKPGGHFAFTARDDSPRPAVLEDIIETFDQEALAATLGKWYHISADDYKCLAIANGFEATEISVFMFPHDVPTVDGFIDQWYAIFHGKFDRSSPLLDGVRKKYQGQEIHCSYPMVNAVLTKPL